MIDFSCHGRVLCTDTVVEYIDVQAEILNVRQPGVIERH